MFGAYLSHHVFAWKRRVDRVLFAFGTLQTGGACGCKARNASYFDAGPPLSHLH